MIGLVKCGDDVCELLEQVPNPSTCSLSLCGDHCFDLGLDVEPDCCTLTSVEAEKLAGVLPRFNITALCLESDDCYDAAVKRRAPATLGQSLAEMLSLKKLVLIWLNEDILQAKEMEALFGGINKTLPSLQKLTLWNFNARGSLAPLNKRFEFFPNLSRLSLQRLNMDELDLRGLLESLTLCPNLKSLDLNYNPLGSKDRVQSIVRRALPQVDLFYSKHRVHPLSEKTRRVQMRRLFIDLPA